MLSLNKYFKTSKLLVVCSFLYTSNITSQTNLISNASFENVTLPINCGGGGFDNYSVNPANHVVDDWYTFQSPDYFNVPCNVAYGVPNNLFGASYAKAGNAYAGIYI